MTGDLIGQFNINFYLHETNNNYKKEKMLNKIYYDTNNSKIIPVLLCTQIVLLLIYCQKQMMCGNQSKT